MLDLKSEYEIASVKIFNREPFQSLSGAEIRVGNNDSFDGNPACVSNLPGESVITVTCGDTGRYVFVVQPRSDTCLHFSEIEVPIRLGCIPCPAGKLSVAVGASAAAACVDCGSGTFENATGSSACKTCDANADSLPGSPNERSCFCKAGFYGDGTSCKACQAGKYTYSHTAAFLREKENPPEASRSYSSIAGGALSMLDSGDAWCAYIESQSANPAWMKIDLGLAMRVHGVVLQARHGYNDYLTEVEVQHSLDPNSGFSSVQSHANGGVRFFPAATFSNKEKSELIFMEPVVARYIKIVPWSWVGGQICTRAGVWKLGGTGSTVCANCEANTYAADTAQTVCTACVAGLYSVAGDSACTTCPAGTYSTGDIVEGAHVLSRRLSSMHSIHRR
jgi:hypothetical protein